VVLGFALLGSAGGAWKWLSPPAVPEVEPATEAPVARSEPTSLDVTTRAEPTVTAVSPVDVRPVDLPPGGTATAVTSVAASAVPDAPTAVPTAKPGPAPKPVGTTKPVPTATPTATPTAKPCEWDPFTRRCK
jgi:hypothetical protein